MKHITSAAVVTAAVAQLSSGLAQAAVSTNEANFLNAISTPVLESFEGLTPDVFGSPAERSSVVTTDFSISDTVLVFDVINGPVAGAFPTDGVQHVVWYANGGGSNSATFSFDSPIDAFGLSISDAEENIGFTTNTGEAGIAAVPGPNANLQFFGITSPGMTTITLTRPNQSDALKFDEVYYEFASGNVVPEPSAFAIWGLLGLTLGGFGWLRRRK